MTRPAAGRWCCRWWSRYERAAAGAEAAGGSRPMTRARSSRPRSTPGKGRGSSAAPFDPFTWLATMLLRWQTFAMLAAAAALVIAVAFWPQVGGTLGAVQRVLVETFGLGLAFVAVALIAISLMIYLHRLPPTRRGLMRLAGAIALAVFLWGIAGWPAPNWTLGGVSLHDVTLGGDIGRFFGRTLLGLLIWTWCGIAAAFILAPRRSQQALNAVPPLARRVHSWRVPQRTAGMVLEGSRALLSLRDGDAPVIESAPSGARPAYEPEEEEGQPALTALPHVSPPRRSATGGETPTVTTSASAGGWQHPPVDLLSPPLEADIVAPDTDQRAKLIVDTLASFGVDARVVSVSRGPTVTQFGVEPGWEVKHRTVVERDSAGRPLLDRDGKPKVRLEEVSRTRV